MEIFPLVHPLENEQRRYYSISLELAKVIQEQQQYIQDNLGEYLNTYFVQENLMVSTKDRKKIYSQTRCDDCCLLYQR